MVAGLYLDSSKVLKHHVYNRVSVICFLKTANKKEYDNQILQNPPLQFNLSSTVNEDFFQRKNFHNLAAF